MRTKIRTSHLPDKKGGHCKNTTKSAVGMTQCIVRVGTIEGDNKMIVSVGIRRLGCVFIICMTID